MVGELLWRFGTSSWSERSWLGPVYPPGTAAGDFLTHYARRFGAVEADTTYYRVPAQSVVAGWRAKTPSGFRMAAKFPRGIVHAGSGPRPDADRALRVEVVGDELDAFLKSMSFLGDRVGPLLVQLPYFNRTHFKGEDEFLARLDTFLSALPPPIATGDVACSVLARGRRAFGVSLRGSGERERDRVGGSLSSEGVAASRARRAFAFGWTWLEREAKR